MCAMLPTMDPVKGSVHYLMYPSAKSDPDEPARSSRAYKRRKSKACGLGLGSVTVQADPGSSSDQQVAVSPAHLKELKQRARRKRKHAMTAKQLKGQSLAYVVSELDDIYNSIVSLEQLLIKCKERINSDDYSSIDFEEYKDLKADIAMLKRVAKPMLETVKDSGPIRSEYPQPVRKKSTREKVPRVASSAAAMYRSSRHHSRKVYISPERRVENKRKDLPSCVVVVSKSAASLADQRVTGFATKQLVAKHKENKRSPLSSREVTKQLGRYVKALRKTKHAPTWGKKGSVSVAS